MDKREELLRLNAEFQKRRNEIITRDGGINPFCQYPELDEISGKMFEILSGGTGVITIAPEQVYAWSK